VQLPPGPGAIKGIQHPYPAGFPLRTPENDNHLSGAGFGANPREGHFPERGIFEQQPPIRSWIWCKRPCGQDPGWGPSRRPWE